GRVRPGSCDRFSRDHQAGLDATPSQLYRNQAGHSEVCSTMRQLIRPEHRAKVQGDLHALPLQLNCSIIVSDSSIVPICRNNFTLLSIASTACFNSDAERPQFLRVEAKAPRSERICSAAAVTATSVRPAGRRHPRSSGLLDPLTSFRETK